jgi:hypothetical protein
MSRFQSMSATSSLDPKVRAFAIIGLVASTVIAALVTIFNAVCYYQ